MPWAVGCLIALLLLVWVQAYFFIRFDNSDDTHIMRATMGYEGGTPATFFLCVSSLLLTPLSWLTRLISGTPWGNGLPLYSLLQLFFLLFSVTVIVKSILQITAQKGNPLWLGLSVAVVTSVSIGTYAIARPQFTTTSAVLAAAASAQMVSMARSRRCLFSGFLLAGLLMTVAYMNRENGLYAFLPVWMLCVLYVVFVRTREHGMSRACVAGLLAGVCCLGVAVGVRVVEKSAPATKEFFAFHEATTPLLDYNKPVSKQKREEAGWISQDEDILRQWYFMDSDFTSQRVSQLVEEDEEEITESLKKLPSSLHDAIYYNPCQYHTVRLMLCFWAICLVATKKKEDWPLLACATAALLGSIAMVAYLCLLGRAIIRAMNCALFPAFALMASLVAGADMNEKLDYTPTRKLLWLVPVAGVCALLTTEVVTVAASNLVYAALAASVFVAAFAKLPQGGWAVAKRWRYPVLLALALCVINIGSDVFVASQSTVRDLPVFAADNVLADEFDTYALEHPDKLLVRNPSLFRDTRFLPDTSRGVPPNAMEWGNWNCRTPTWYGQMERYGFDGHNFHASDFLNDTILFADTADVPPSYLTNYIAAHIGRPVNYELYGTYGQLYFFHLY